ncbi:MAG: acetyl-CoA hydrolase/transferase C-terminal domain-containing protein [Oscillospiraceae bacterium]|nr:acetyl-CoA hydrolase/transferase C-terminal domain-containing protein [Oscillospiraceae bacterium]
MADWKKYYEEHLVTMSEAAGKIESGDTIWMGSTLCIPYAFMDALAERVDELSNITLLGNMYLAPTQIMMDPSYKKTFHTISFFANVLERMASSMGTVDFHSAPYGTLIETVSEVYKANVVAIEICPPDADGNCNVGVLGTNFTPNIIKGDGVKKRIAVINSYQPFATGSDSVTKLPLSMFDYIVENHHDIPSLPVSPPTEYDKLIAEHIMPYISDGDTIQIGMGGLGNQIAYDLKSKKDLHVFTEIGTDAMIDLVESGVVKDIRMGGAFGSKELYQWLGKRSDVVTLLDVNDVVTPEAVEKIDNIVAINSTFMVDITGQACSEAQGPKQYSAVGGSYGFLSGAPKAKNGRSFLCLRSTYTDKAGVQHSNIVAMLPEGSVVTTPRYIPQYIVTEYGVANVYLRSNKDRIKALLAITHPDFKEEIKQQAISLGMIAEDDF